jgi:chemotaxis response regulator CheB
MAAGKNRTKTNKFPKNNSNNRAIKPASAMRSGPFDSVSAERRKFPVVGIGASAGGLEAIEGFFANTPSELNIAFVIIQHLAPEIKA